MKKKRGFFIKAILFFMFAVIIFSIYYQTNVIYKPKDTLNIKNLFSGIASGVYSDYINGKYGQELYYLASGGGWGGIGDIAIYRNNDVAQIIVYQKYGRFKKRNLTSEELQNFLKFIASNQIDTLSNWDSHMVMDGIEYQYMHFSKDKATTFYMNNPASTNIEPLYQALVEAFFSTAETGVFDVHYSINGNENKAKVLIVNEMHKVESVWKDGDDFHVLINENDKLEWYGFKDGKLLEPEQEPSGFTLKNAWSDIPADYIYHDHINNFPWQVTWNSYRVRMIHKPHGLYLTKEDEVPILISENLYGNPVVIPNTNWVVCSRAENGWAYPNDIVKIDLETFQEFTLNLPPSDTLYPIVYINNKLLIAREKAQYSFEYYLYDVQSDTFNAVNGEFSKLGNNFRERFLQPTVNENEYYCTTRSDGTIVGTFSFSSYKFKKIIHLDGMHFDSKDMWLDGQKDVLYLVVNHDLLEISL